MHEEKNSNPYSLLAHGLSAGLLNLLPPLPAPLPGCLVVFADRTIPLQTIRLFLRQPYAVDMEPDFRALHDGNATGVVSS